MKSILAKLSPKEIKELSKALNAAQKKNFGNPLSLRKQEQMMAEVFGVKDWSTLLGISQPETSKYDPNSPYQKTIVQIEILSNGAFPTEYNLDTIHDEITNGDCSGQYIEISRQSLTKEQMSSEAIAQGSDPEFFLLGEEVEAVDDNEYDKKVIFNYLMEVLFNEQEEFYMNEKPDAVAGELSKLFKRERDHAISKYNRLNVDPEYDTLSPTEKILCEDKIDFAKADLIKRIKAHG